MELEAENVCVSYGMRQEVCTYLSPVMSVTGVPSSESQVMTGAGVPWAVHEILAPVELENESRGGGSIRKISWLDVEAAEEENRELLVTNTILRMLTKKKTT